MNTMLLKMYVRLQDLLSREEGQDLIEYALIAALIALAATAAMSAVGTQIGKAFSAISTTLAGAM
jgi:pilus assembly protein Flp/PilA